MMDDGYFSSEEFLEKLKLYEEAQKEGRNVFIEPDFLADIAEYYHDKGRLEEAIKAAEIGVEMFPGAVSPLVFMARIELFERENPEKARWYAEQVEEKDDPDYTYLMAEILIFEEKDEELICVIFTKTWTRMSGRTLCWMLPIFMLNTI